MTESIGIREARNRLDAIMAQDVSFPEKADQALELGKTVLDVDNGHLTTIDPPTQYWKAIASTDDTTGRFPPGLTLDLDTTYCRRTITQPTSIQLHDAEAQGWDDDPTYQTHELDTYHGTRLKSHDGDIFGTVCFVSTDPRPAPFSETETLFAELIASVLEADLQRTGLTAELTRREGFMTVLNRVLRHNLRNDLNVIQGYVDLLDTDHELTADQLAAIREKTRGLLRISEKLRRVEPRPREGNRRKAAIDDLVERLAADIAAEYRAASITVDATTDLTLEVTEGFETALYELLENAAKHTGPNPKVMVEVELVPNAIEISIRDNGPGLPAQEAAVLERGSETMLSHGSGIGLGIAAWVISSFGGTVTATNRDDGTTITVQLPRTTPPEKDNVPQPT